MKKKLLAILLAAIMLLTCVSCGGKAPENEPSTPDSSDASAYTATARKLDTKLSDGYSAVCFRSVEELNAFYEEEIREENAQVFAQYDAEYFADHVLTVVVLLTRNLGTRYQVNGAELTVKNGEETTVLQVQGLTCDADTVMQYWSIFIETEQALFEDQMLETQNLDVFLYKEPITPSQEDASSLQRLVYTATARKFGTVIPDGYSAVCFRSVEELNAAYSEETREENAQFFAQYDETYFADRVLTVITMQASDHGTRYQINGVEIAEENGEDVVVLQVHDILCEGSLAEQRWSIFIETEQALFEGQMLKTQNLEMLLIRETITRAQQQYFE